MPADSNLRQRLKSLFQMLGGVVIVAVFGILLRFALVQKSPPGWLAIHPPRDVNALALFQGQLWSGGKDGVYRIDPENGLVLQKLSLGSGEDFSFTTSLALAPDGNRIWIGHLGGLSSFDGKNWQHYTKEDGLPDNQVLAVLHHSGKGVWIATARGLVLLNSLTNKIDQIEFKPTRGPFSVLYLDSKGILYAGNGHSKEGGLLTYDGTEWAEVSSRDGLAHPMVNTILETPEGTLYFGTGFSNQGGLSINQGERWETLSKADGLAGNKVRYLFQDQNGVLWVGSEFEGIAVQGAPWTILTPEDGLAGWEVKAMLQDQAGRLWFGTENGLSRIEKSTWLEIISSSSSNPDQ